MPNIDSQVVHDFGVEWTRFNQSRLPAGDFEALFDSYFSVFPWNQLPAHAVGADIGCGSGRWAVGVAPRVGLLHCVDPSEDALVTARRNLAAMPNCVFHRTSTDALPFPDASLDFAYSLGVLHHLPSPQAGLDAVVRKVKIGAPVLVYLYYRFDNRPAWFRLIWRGSDFLRRFISRSPKVVKHFTAELIAASTYWPLARLARVLESIGVRVDTFPLAQYRHRSFYVMRTDALDRFGTKLEHRVLRSELHQMMEAAGLTDITFSESPPYWIAAGSRTH